MYVVFQCKDYMPVLPVCSRAELWLWSWYTTSWRSSKVGRHSKWGWYLFFGMKFHLNGTEHWCKWLICLISKYCLIYRAIEMLTSNCFPCLWPVFGLCPIPTCNCNHKYTAERLSLWLLAVLIETAVWFLVVGIILWLTNNLVL